MRSTMLVIVSILAFLGGCGGGGGGGDDEPTRTIPENLIGSWYRGSVSPTDFYHPTGDQWNHTSRDGTFYTFTGDGQFERGNCVASAADGCTEVSMTFESGRVVADAAAQSLTLIPKLALLHNMDDCHPEGTETKTIAPSPETISWEFGDDGFGTPALMVRTAGGQPSAFYSWEVGTTPRTSLPSELAGGWSNGAVSSVGFYDPSSGSWSDPSGSGFFYRFAASGDYTFGGLMQSSFGGCTLSFFQYEEGTVTLQDGNALTVYPVFSRVRKDDTCNPSGNYERDGDTTPRPYTIRLGHDEFGIETLALRWPDGSETSFRRE